MLVRRSVDRLVGRSVFLILFWPFWAYCSCPNALLQHCSCPPARDWGIRVSSLVTYYTPLFSSQGQDWTFSLATTDILKTFHSTGTEDGVHKLRRNAARSISMRRRHYDAFGFGSRNDWKRRYFSFGGKTQKDLQVNDIISLSGNIIDVNQPRYFYLLLI